MKFIIDFDSTFIQTEALDELSHICLAGVPNRSAIIKQIKHITRLGMEGKISFDVSLTQRLELLNFHKNHINTLVALLADSISLSIKKNRKFFINQRENTYIVSGGFREFIEPVVMPYGIRQSHILANTLQWNKQEVACSFDAANPLAKSGGKAIAVNRLALSGTVIAVGDGWSDYEIKKAGSAHYFIAYVENCRRKAVIPHADKIASSFDDLLQWIDMKI
jgi:D-3-phosphoglycerate dehydrogenase / 2-oxoglutarate reductase